jgi:hypothetical protein
MYGSSFCKGGKDLERNIKNPMEYLSLWQLGIRDYRDAIPKGEIAVNLVRAIYCAGRIQKASTLPLEVLAQERCSQELNNLTVAIYEDVGALASHVENGLLPLYSKDKAQTEVDEKKYEEERKAIIAELVADYDALSSRAAKVGKIQPIVDKILDARIALRTLTSQYNGVEQIVWADKWRDVERIWQGYRE